MCKTTVYNGAKHYRLGGAWISEEELHQVLQEDLLIVTRRKAVEVVPTKNGSYKARIYSNYQGKHGGYVSPNRFQILSRSTVDKYNNL